MAKPQKQLSEQTLKYLVTNALKKDKFEVRAAAAADDGASIKFEAMSESGMIRVKGELRDPQEELELEEQEPDEKEEH
jgi:hypothetical protein